MFEANLQGIQFLQTELELANTFLDIGEASGEPAHQEQSRRDAGSAYQSILHFLPRLQVTAGELAIFEHHLALLRRRLLAAGIAL